MNEDPGFAKAHAALGAAYYSFVFGDREKGKAHFDKAIEFAPRTTDREQRSIKAAYAHQLGRWDEAVDLYRGYLQSYPDDFRIRYNLGGVLRQLARFDEAVAQYQHVLRVAPQLRAGTHQPRELLQPARESADAVRHYERAFELDSGRIAAPNINHEYGFVLVEAGEVAKARTTFERALASPARPSALRSLALLDMYEGKYRAAATRLDEALVLNVSAKNALNEARNRLFLAMALDARGRRTEARRELGLAARAASAAKANPWVFSRIGVAMARAGMVAGATALRGEVRKKSDPGSSDNWRICTGSMARSRLPAAIARPPSIA